MKKQVFAFLSLIAFMPIAFGQAKDYPRQPIKVIVSTAAGSSADNLARYLGQELAVVLGQTVVVENKPGGDGVVAVMALKGAPADGHTILLTGNTPVAVNPLVMKSMPYDAVKDLRPVSGIAQSMNVLVVAADSPLNTLADLVATAKKSKQALNVGTAFMAYYLDVGRLASLTGVKFNNIPYKGTAQVLTDVIGQQLDFGFVERGVAAPLLKAGKVKALAVTGKARHPDSAAVPTVSESGYPQYSAYAWTAYFIRSETPKDVAAKVSEAIQEVLAKDSSQAYIRGLGLEPMTFKAEAMKTFIAHEHEKYRVAAQSLDVKPQ